MKLGTIIENIVAGDTDLIQVRAEGATAPETLRQMDRGDVKTLESWFGAIISQTPPKE